MNSVTQSYSGRSCIGNPAPCRVRLTKSHSVITELIIGYILPGRPLAMMMFKTWGYITMAQALTFTNDL